MIILIGGASLTGKTLMAQKLLEKYKYPYLSIDHLKMGLYRANINYDFTPLDSFEYIAEKLWSILQGIIMTAIENNQNLIIEGSYLLPNKILKIQKEYQENIISFYLGFSSSYIKKYFKTKIIYNQSIIELRKYTNDNTYLNYIEENKKQKKLCQKYNGKYFEIKDNYNEEIDCACTWLDEVLVKRG